MTKAEKHIHQQVCRYIDLQYPNVIYTSDPSGTRVSIGIAKELKAKRCKKFKIPDLIILHPSKDYCGLIIEIKASIDDVFTKKLEWRTSEHIAEQKRSIEQLQALGYYATFGIGFENTRKIIDEYMNKN
jgi:hypothetical protein